MHTGQPDAALIIGTGPHAKFVAEVAGRNGYVVAGYIARDPPTPGQEFAGLPIVGCDAELQELQSKYPFAFVGVGDPLHNTVRAKVFRSLRAFRVPPLIHPYANVAPSATVGRGSLVCPGAIISTDAVIGKNCIINCGAVVSHDCIVADHCHVAPGGVLGGNVALGEYSTVGMCATVCMGVMVGTRVLIPNNKSVFVDVPDRGRP